jgi:hypothetical protein
MIFVSGRVFQSQVQRFYGHRVVGFICDAKDWSAIFHISLASYLCGLVISLDDLMSRMYGTGWFGRGQMQEPFEKATYGLKVGELSDIIDTDSGSHIILRTG